MSDDHPLFCVCDLCSSKVASAHWAADEACGRDWRTGGCQCGPCRSLRAWFDDIDARFARIAALQDKLAEWRRTQQKGAGTK